MKERLQKYNEVLFKKQYNINLLHWELMLEAPNSVTDYLINLINEQEIELFKLGTSNEYKKLLLDYLGEHLPASELPRFKRLKNEIYKEYRN